MTDNGKRPDTTSYMSSNSDQGFLSKTKRTDHWRNDVSHPYTKQSYYQSPAPGAYNVDKKKDDVKNKILMEETLHVPFGGSDERGCNKKVKNSNPGPGSYIDINNPLNSSICKSMNKIKEDRSLAES